VKVAFINQPWNTCPTDAGSIAIWTYHVAKALAADDEVVVYAKQGPKDLAHERHEGIEFRRYSIGQDRRLAQLLRKVRLDRPRRIPMFASALFYLPYWLKVSWDLRRRHCDIIHLPNFSQAVPILKLFNPRSCIVLHMHCEWLSQIDHRIAARRLRHASAVLGISDHITDRIAGNGIHYRGRLGTVYNGTYVPDEDVSTRPQQNSASPVILFVGRLSPEKGLHTLIEAFARVAEKHPGAVLRLVGPDAVAPREYIVDLALDDAHLQALAAFYAQDYPETLRASVPETLANRVEFIGPVPHQDIGLHYRAAHILINPSFSESFGRSLIEGMSEGLPVIATRVGGMPEIVIDRQTGYLVEPGDVAALAEAMDRLLADPALRLGMGQKGWQRARDVFSWPSIAGGLGTLYRDISAAGCA